MAQLHDHKSMIELNPLVLRHEPTTPPPNATPDEASLGKWYLITDRINYLPGGAVKGEVSYKACFYDLPGRGIQTHVFAPAGVDIKSKWSIGGNVPGKEPREAAELGVTKPRDGLYIKEELDLRCNLFMSSFVKKNLKKSHMVVVDKIIRRAENPAQEAAAATLHQRTGGDDGVFSITRINQSTGDVPDLFNRAPAVLSGPTSLPTHATKSFQHRDIQYSCACEGTSHLPTCSFFHSDDLRCLGTMPSPFRASQPRPFHAISLPASASSHSGSSGLPSPRLEQSLFELYGSTSPGECLCTGALHEKICASYPRLRAPRPPTARSADGPTWSMQQSPEAACGSGYNMPSIESQAHTVEQNSTLPQNLSLLASGEQEEQAQARSTLDKWLQRKMMPEPLHRDPHLQQASSGTGTTRLRQLSWSPDPR